MYRAEVFIFALFSGFFISELLETISNYLFKMILPELSPGVQFFIMFIITCIFIVTCVGLHILRQGLQMNLVDYIRSKLFIFQKKVEIEWPDHWEAETTKCVTFSFFQQIPNSSDISLKVYCNGDALYVTEIWNEDQTSLELIFPAQKSGMELLM